MPIDTKWFEDDDFWQLVEPYLFPDSSWERAGEQVDQLVERLKLNSGAKILDLPSGPGRHAVQLASRGMDVTAVDRTEAYIEQLRSEAKHRNLELEALVGNMRQFHRPGEFDAVVNLFTSFGYFDQAGNRRTLKNFYNNLRPGGRLLIDVIGKEPLARRFQPHDWHETDDGALLLEERTLNDDVSRIQSRWILITPDNQRHEFNLDHRLYSGAELRALFEQVGFTDVDVIGSIDGQPYGLDTPRLVVVGTRPQ